MPDTRELQSAKLNKKDEFYTQYEDIAAEMKYYSEYLRGKTVYCNCDDPKTSNFWKYFHQNFSAFGLRRLIATYYDEDHAPSVYLYDGGNDNDVKSSQSRVLSGDGDFAGAECAPYLKEADVVITNPPFSKFRTYLALLIEQKKDFLILGNINAVTYKEIFPLFRDNRIWLGVSIHSGDRKFDVPDDYPLEAAGCGIDELGKRFIRVKGVRWFTNIETMQRHKSLWDGREAHFYRDKKDAYPFYDNFQAINVDKTAEIPIDYRGPMGVPITWLDKYNPDEFTIIGNSAELAGSITINGKVKERPQRFYINQKRMYDRIVIQRKL